MTKQRPHGYISMRLHPATVKIKAYPEPIVAVMDLPEGCIRVLFAFKTKAAARKYWGKKTALVPFARDEIKP